MRGRYSAAFVIPRGSTKRLDTDGWTFLHHGVVSPEVKEGLIRELGLDFIDSYDEAEKYGAGLVELSAIHAADGALEELYIKLYGSSDATNLQRAWSVLKVTGCELFIPSLRDTRG
ncbi:MULTISPECIES: hypothetical protein [Luteibacter]|uniref:hypothetical protein n=1 Tax=Luteibacter TaxID=242605 RepID=UPI00056B01D2|nr:MULTISPECIES: hypothetical protein [unclassified Luteibacter]